LHPRAAQAHGARPLKAPIVAIALGALVSIACVRPDPVLANATADSATVLRALIRSQGGSEAEHRAAAWLASVPAGAAFDTTRAVALDVWVEAMLSDGHWADSTSHEAAARAVRAKQALYGPDHIEVARSLITQGRMLYRNGEFDAARACVERGLAIAERSDSGHNVQVVRGLHYLANILEEQTDFAGAERLYRREIDVATVVFGAGSAELGNAYNSFAVLCRKTGRLSESRALYERALAMREAVLGPDHAELIINLNNLGNVLDQMGDFREAIRVHERALAICRRKLDPDHPSLGQLLGNLAGEEASAGDTARALDYYARSLAIREKSGGPMHPDVAFTLVDETPVLIARGEYAAARTALTRAIAIREKSYTPDHPETAIAWEAMGSLDLAVGDAAAARRDFEKSLGMRERSLGPDHPEVAQSWAGIAKAAFAGGDDAAAFTAALRTEAVASAHVRLTARTLEERVALAYAATRPSGLDLAISIALQTHADSAIAGAWDAVIRSRALVLDEMARRERSVTTIADSAVGALADSLREASEHLSWLIASGAGARAGLEQAARKRERIEEALAARSAEFRREESSRSAGWPEVSAALGPHEALIAFVRFMRWTRAPAGASSMTRAEPAYAAFVLRGGGAGRPALIDLGGAAAIDSCVAHWAREAWRRPSLLTRADDERRVCAAGQQLRARAWDPLIGAIGDALAVRIVPDGALQLVSFAALPTSSGRFLVESGATIELLSAERDLANANDARATGAGLLAMGAPDFGSATARKASGACDDLASLRFDPLPASGAEVEEIANAWNASARGVNAIVRLGNRASEAELRSQARGKRAAHIATHGFFLSGECASTPAAAAPDRGASARTLDSLTYSNPLLRSGLALAGANRRSTATSGASDGILTAEEIATLDLSGLDWAVLSGCETGRGELRAGEGVLGLRRAFQIAGARHVIMSLWDVDDDATREWMRALYDAHLKRGEPTGRAVATASRELLRSRRARGLSDHPFYWAAFVAAGAGDEAAR
jgi:CHAT domain-containing protein/tetratricopeptide (TPR) repeat protein